MLMYKRKLQNFRAGLIVGTLMIYRLVARSSAEARTYAIGGKFYIIGVVLINVAHPFYSFFRIGWFFHSPLSCSFILTKIKLSDIL